MKKMITICIVISLSLVSGNLFAQSEAACPSLLIAPGARAGGMGEANVALAEDATATYWNPAGLGFQRGWELSMMHANWLPQFHLGDLYYDFGSLIHHFEGLGTFGLQVIFLNLGEQEGRDEFDNPTGTFNSFEGSVGVSYGVQLSDNFSVGGGMRFIYSKLAEQGVGAERGKGTGSSVGVDLGVLYKFGFGLSFGANLSNMGPKITYIDASQADPIPTNFRIGLAYKILNSEYNKLTVLVDMNKLMVVKETNEETGETTSDPFYKALLTAWTNDGFNTQIKKANGSLGLEYWYSNFFALRAGYFYEDIGKRRFATFGAGIRYSMYGFDFGYIAGEQGHPLTDTMRFTLLIKFGDK